jgi:hypothetical protein
VPTATQTTEGASECALTAAGRALLRDLGPVAERSQSEFLDALSRSERATLVSLLRRVLDANDEARLAEGRQVWSAFLVRDTRGPPRGGCA